LVPSESRTIRESTVVPKIEVDDVEQLPLVHAVSVPLSFAVRVYNVDRWIRLSITAENPVASVTTVDAVPNVVDPAVVDLVSVTA
jgi:hypothetical protein